MRKYNLLFLLTAVLLLACGSDSDVRNADSDVGGAKPESGAVSSAQIIYNPDMGFYSAETITVQADGSVNKTSVGSADFLDEKGNYDPNANFNLIHLKVDISECKNLSHLDLSGIDTLLSNLEKAEQTAVIRFAYDKKYNGNKSGVEPEDFSTILNHIEDICSLLKKHTKVLTALECGMLGPWGEMHTTDFAEKAMSAENFTKTLKSISPELNPSIEEDESEIEKGYIVLIMEKFLSCLEDTELPFLVRQPNFIYNYLKRCENLDFDGKNVPSSYTPSGKTYKLGIYNDGYLGSAGDSGTFRIDREGEIRFLEPFTNHTPYGGELIGNYSLSESDGQLTNVHLSFLNIGWNDTVLGNLDETSADYTQGTSIFKYILIHMGYRYLITDSSIKKASDSALKIKLSLKNEGFAELPYHRSKSLKVYFVKKGLEVSEENAISAKTSGTFTGEMSSISASVTLPLGLESGEYDLYLKICDSDGKYAIRLANDDIWNESLKANKIGGITHGE